MPQPHERPHTRAFALKLTLSALALVLAQVAVYLLILEDTVGGVSLRRVPPHPSMTGATRVLVLRSDATARLGQREGYEQRLVAWIEALEGARLSYQVVPEAALPDALEGATAVVLPGATCLGDPARAAVRRFLAEGHGVVATGAVGARDGECRWRGWDFLRGLSGASHVETAVLPGSVFAAFRGGEFHEGVVPAGYRLALPHQELVLLETERPSAYATDWRLRPARGGARLRSALAAHRDSGLGRVFWLGFDESSAGRQPAAQATLEALLAVSAAWTAREPIATVATWPQARPAAAMALVVAGDSDERLRALAQALRQAGLNGSFVADSRGLPFDPGPSADLVTPGDGDDPFIGEPSERQRRRLVDARVRLAARQERTVTGFRPPAGATDAATIRAVAAAGLSYTVGEVGGLRATPELVEIPSRLMTLLPGRQVVRLFQVAADDQEVLAGAEDPAQAFVQDLDRVFELGGLYPLLLNADLAGGSALLPAVRELLRHAAARGAWLASGSEIAGWWVARQGLQTTAKRLSPTRLQVDLSNRGQQRARDVVVLVHLPYAPRRVALRSPVLRLHLPQHSLERDVLRLVFADVAPQSNETYVISLDE